MKFEFTVNGVIDFLGSQDKAEAVDGLGILGSGALEQNYIKLGKVLNKLRKIGLINFRAFAVAIERGTSPNAVFKEAIERFMNDEM